MQRLAQIQSNCSFFLKITRSQISCNFNKWRNIPPTTKYLFLMPWAEKPREELNTFHEKYNTVFNLYLEKQYFFFPYSIKISLSELYLDMQTWMYLYYKTYFLNINQVQYFKIFVMFVLILAISVLLFVVASFLSLNIIKDSEKLSQYECGFEPFDEATRHPFDVHFYMVGILFLIFDVEIALLFPWIYSLHLLNWLGFYTMILFILILTVGFYYEWNRGALAWPHQKLLKNKKLVV